jgi:hypothetical protein
MANFTHKLDPVITQTSTGNILMKLEIWVDGSLEIICTSFSFLPVLNILVAMATNRLKIWEILHINLIQCERKK